MDKTLVVFLGGVVFAGVVSLHDDVKLIRHHDAIGEFKFFGTSPKPSSAWLPCLAVGAFQVVVGLDGDAFFKQVISLCGDL